MYDFLAVFLSSSTGLCSCRVVCLHWVFQATVLCPSPRGHLLPRHAGAFRACELCRSCLLCAMFFLTLSACYCSECNLNGVCMLFWKLLYFWSYFFFPSPSKDSVVDSIAQVFQEPTLFLHKCFSFCVHLE